MSGALFQPPSGYRTVQSQPGFFLSTYSTSQRTSNWGNWISDWIHLPIWKRPKKRWDPCHPCLVFIFQRIEVGVFIFLTISLALVNDLLYFTLAILSCPLPRCHSTQRLGRLRGLLHSLNRGPWRSWRCGDLWDEICKNWSKMIQILGISWNGYDLSSTRFIHFMTWFDAKEHSPTLRRTSQRVPSFRGQKALPLGIPLLLFRVIWRCTKSQRPSRPSPFSGPTRAQAPLLRMGYPGLSGPRDPASHSQCKDKVP